MYVIYCSRTHGSLAVSETMGEFTIISGHFHTQPHPPGCSQELEPLRAQGAGGEVGDLGIYETSMAMQQEHEDWRYL